MQTSFRLLLAAPILAALAHSVPAQEKLQVVATIPDLASLVRSIGGDAVEVETLIQPGQDPHMVLGKPSMLLKISRADALIEMGMNYEHAFLPQMLLRCRNDQVLPGGRGFLNASAGVRPLEVPATVDRSQGADLHPLGNPHFNLDPENGRIIARSIRDLLKSVDPQRAEVYEANWKQWDAEAQRRIAEWEKLMAPHRGAKIVTYHRSWTYFTERYGLAVAGEAEPKPGLSPSAGHLARLARTMKAESVKLLFIEPWYNERSVAGLLEATGAKLVKLHTTCGATPATREYLDWMDELIRRVAAELGAAGEGRG